MGRSWLVSKKAHHAKWVANSEHIHTFQTYMQAFAVDKNGEYGSSTFPLPVEWPVKELTILPLWS